MPSTEDSARFTADLKQRIEELVTWTIEHWPDPNRPLTRSDFDAVRQQLMDVAAGHSDIGDRNAAVPEPSENGPQYVNVNPAPWP